MSHVESDPEECIFHCTLPWRDDELNELIQRCNAMMSLSREHINIYLSIYLSVIYIYIYIYLIYDTFQKSVLGFIRWIDLYI